MRALVTGGAGLIGSHIVDLLLDEGWDVRIIDNLDPAVHPNGRKPEWVPDVPFFRGDIVNETLLARAMQEVDVVFHQAAFGGFSPDAVKMTHANCLGTARVVAEAERLGVGRLVVASSQAVYGKVDTPEPIPESAATYMLTWPYALSKLYAERISVTSRVPTVALRYALTYGPRQSPFNPYTGICSIFSTALLNGHRPVVYEDGLQTRDFTYVEDVARANLIAATNDDWGGVFNVGTGRATTVLAFARMLAAAYGVDIEPALPGTYRPADSRHVITDPSRIEEYGWRAKVPVEKGVARFAEWFERQPLPPYVFPEAEAKLVARGDVL